MNSQWYPQEISILKLQPRAAWISILGLALFILIFLLVGGAKLLIVLFPIASFVTGVFLYRRYPIMYVSFTLWLWILTTLVARLIGFKLGILVPGGNACAPIVTWICAYTFFQNLPKIIKNRDGESLLFIICFGSVLYSLILRWIQNIFPGSIQSEAGMFLSALAPILLGFHLYVNWKDYPQYKSNIQSTFFWIVVFLGGYGIIQFLVAPPWDTQSMLLTTGENSWMGKPFPLEIRVFSTMTNPFTFSLNLLPGLILLNISKNRWRFIPIILGYLGIFLSQYRTAWYTWLIATVILIISQKNQKQIRLLSTLTLIILIVLILINVEPFSSVIAQRLETLSNLSEDGSGQIRIAQYSNALNFALTEFIGKGFGNEDIYYDNTLVHYSGFDVGMIQILLSLGWIGAIPYVGSLLLLVSKMFWRFPSRADLFAASSRAIVVASIIRVITSSIIFGDFALPIWLFLGIGMAARKYYLETVLVSNYS